MRALLFGSALDSIDLVERVVFRVVVLIVMYLNLSLLPRDSCTQPGVVVVVVMAFWAAGISVLETPFHRYQLEGVYFRCVFSTICIQCYGSCFLEGVVTEACVGQPGLERG